MPIILIGYMLLVRLFLIFSFDLDLDGAEFTFVHYIQQLLQAKNLYLNPETYPYSAVIYTPLYLYVVFFITKLFHLDYIKHIHEIYIIGRSVSFISILASIFVVDLLIKKQTINRVVRVSAIFIFLNLISGHAFVMRPDGMKILFFLAFFYHYLNYFFYDKKIKNLLLIFTFLVLAFMTKQDVIVYIFLIQLVHLVLVRNARIFFVFISSISLICISIYFIKIVFGEYIFVNLFQFNLQTISNVNGSYNLLVVLFNAARILPIYAFVFYCYFQVPKANKQIRITCLIALISCLIATFFLFRPGSYINYTYESLILLMFAFFLVIKKYIQPFSIYIVIYFTLFFFSNLIIKNYAFFPFKEIKCANEYSNYYSLRKQILPLLDSQTTLFMPNLKLSIFLADKQIIYGQEYHLDRLIYSNLGLKSSSKLKFNSSSNYDNKFENGTVQYILAFDKKSEIETIKIWYPKYVFEQKINQFLLYKFRNL